MENEKEAESSLTVERKILRVNLLRKSVESMKDEIVVEELIELYVNDECYAVFSTSPHQIKELAVGHLLTEGIIDKTEEITSLEVSKGKVHVNLNKKARLKFSKPQLILSACGAGTKNPKVVKRIMKVKTDLNEKLDYQTILRAVETLNSQAYLFRRTGGTHASVLLDKIGNILAFSEDIGRHNAIDKVVGKAALENVDLSKTLLASTGRLASEIVAKAASAGVPVVISISAPTDKGIKIAEMAGLTLVGFARGKRLNVYTHPERLEKNLS